MTRVESSQSHSFFQSIGEFFSQIAATISRIARAIFSCNDPSLSGLSLIGRVHRLESLHVSSMGGIRNPHTNCYFNSQMQLIAHNPSLSKIILDIDISAYDEPVKRELATNLKALIANLKKPEAGVSNTRLVDLLREGLKEVTGKDDYRARRTMDPSETYYDLVHQLNLRSLQLTAAAIDTKAIKATTQCPTPPISPSREDESPSPTINLEAGKSSLSVYRGSPEQELPVEESEEDRLTPFKTEWTAKAIAEVYTNPSETRLDFHRLFERIRDGSYEKIDGARIESDLQEAYPSKVFSMYESLSNKVLAMQDDTAPPLLLNYDYIRQTRSAFSEVGPLDSTYTVPIYKPHAEAYRDKETEEYTLLDETHLGAVEKALHGEKGAAGAGEGSAAEVSLLPSAPTLLREAEYRFSGAILNHGGHYSYLDVTHSEDGKATYIHYNDSSVTVVSEGAAKRLLQTKGRQFSFTPVETIS